MLLVFIGLYFLLTLGVGLWSARLVKNTADFAVAGRRLPLPMAASALFATWFGSETILGSSSVFIEEGVIGVIEDPFGAALCLFLVGILFVRPLYRLNLLTFSDYFRIRYNRLTELMSAIFMVPSYFGWIAAQLVALALVLNSLTGLSTSTAIICCTIIVLLYTYFGGMWAVSITDFIQTIIIILGLIFLAISLYDEVGGLSTLITEQKPDFFRAWPRGNIIDILLYVNAWMTIGLGSIPQQDVFQRVMAAKSEKISVQASFTASAMYLVIGLIPLFIGLAGVKLYPDLLSGDTQLLIPGVVLRHGGVMLQVFFFGALLSAILSTTSGAILAPATIIGENVIKPFFKNMTDKQLLLVMRLSVIIVAMAATLLALWRQNIYELVAESSAFSLVSLFAPFFLGLYWKKANATGATLSMIIGMITWLVGTTEAWEVPPMLVGFAASIAAHVIGSLIFPGTLFDRPSTTQE